VAAVEATPGGGAGTPGPGGAEPRAGRRSLVLTGFMGAGKTTAARILADTLGVEEVDTDELLEARFGRPVARIFEEEGEAAFRAAEEQVVAEVLHRLDPPAVVALGGGAVESERVQAALAAHLVVLLEIDAPTAWARAAGDRPLARDRAAFEARLERRAPLYERLADAIVPPVPLGALPGVAPALVFLRDHAPRGTRLVWAHGASGDYPVLAARGLLGGAWPIPGRRFVVSDETVAALYPSAVPDPVARIEIAPGEVHKSPATAETVWRALARAGMTGADHLVALGGGVVGDLAGFAAATYRRGVPVVHVPTTLVAQVDSALGGKTGVDLPEGKNYVGAYHQPAAVLIDPATLETLPAEELAAGWAEVVKTALIAGGPLWARVRAGVLDDDVVLACVRGKLAIVARDERDGGPRQVLNLGHTVGHAIETATGYARYRHGEAVGLGLLAALRLSGQGGLRDEVAALLRARGLPTVLEPPLGADELIALTGRDKKRRGAAPVPFVLVEAPGRVAHGRTVDDGDLRAAVTELGAT
jgi:shikimate kinase/3-dehydroquinate synthase